MKHLFCYLLHLEVVHLENIVDPSRNGIVSGPLFLGGGLILIIRTSNLRVKEKCERIKSEHNGVVNSLWFRCLRVSHHWLVSDGSCDQPCLCHEYDDCLPPQLF